MQSKYSRSLAFVSLCVGLAATGGVPAAAAGFLSSGPGARAAAMGGAFTAVADDASAIYYNPAGLAQQRGALMLEHAPIAETGAGFTFNDGRLDFLGLVYPSRVGTFGFGFQQFAIGGIETRATLADQATVVSVSQNAFFIPYAVQYKGWSLGITGKAVTSSLAGYSGTGFGADIGVKNSHQFGDTFLGRDTQLTLGAAVRNALAPTLKLYQNPTALERTSSVGLALSAFVREHYEASTDRVSHDRLSLAVDASVGNQDSGFGMAFGLDYSYLDRYGVRVGFNADRNLTIGIGAGGPSSTFRVDYASVLTGLAPQHRLTVAWQFTDAPTSVQGDVHLSEYRRAVLDRERLLERFLHEGRSAVAEGHYDVALAAFQKAQALDPHDSDITGLVQSSQEGSRLAGVKELLDATRREQAATHDEFAVKAALQAVLADPGSHEAADYAVILRNQMIAGKTSLTYDVVRAGMVDGLTRQFNAALVAHNAYGMRQALTRIKAIDPDDAVAWQPLADKLAGSLIDWQRQYLRDAQAALASKDAIALSRAVRRVRRVAPAEPALPSLAKQLRKLSSEDNSSFYQTNFLAQLYYSAASEYALGAYQSAVSNIVALLRANATHLDGNALIDRMRDEGRISEEEEP